MSKLKGKKAAEEALERSKKELRPDKEMRPPKKSTPKKITDRPGRTGERKSY